ncbi:hypothetical protein M5U04_06855 [Xenorhabdus sp. XENO-1]|uniref:hypothetical protein n=1 Tax=Xenorhabdus bovienii TaxID=40576 RepID=UPI0020CA41F0|nr:hypothetical protein [Xenorhabdus bovienii]MCP9267826.1 hypothetical protein [Xenorhabdus bovienii subsp. africana]
MKTSNLGERVKQLLKQSDELVKRVHQEKHANTQAMFDVIAEMNRQDERWGGNSNLSPFVWQKILIKALTEEASEFELELAQQAKYSGVNGWSARGEMVQVAVIALQIVEMYDRLGQVKRNELKKIKIELPCLHTTEEFVNEPHDWCKERMVARDETIEEIRAFIEQQGFEVTQ